MKNRTLSVLLMFDGLSPPMHTETDHCLYIILNTFLTNILNKYQTE